MIFPFVYFDLNLQTLCVIILNQIKIHCPFILWNEIFTSKYPLIFLDKRAVKFGQYSIRFVSLYCYILYFSFFFISTLDMNRLNCLERSLKFLPRTSARNFRTKSQKIQVRIQNDTFRFMKDLASSMSFHIFFLVNIFTFNV